MMNATGKDTLEHLVAVCGFDKVLEELADLAYRKGDQVILPSVRRNYYHLAVDLEPAIKSAIERGL